MKEDILISSQAVTSERYISEKSAEDLVFAFEIEPGEKGYLSLDRNMISHLLKLYLGYPDKDTTSTLKLTGIEENALFQLVKDMVKELHKAWTDDLRIGEISPDHGKGSGDRFAVSKFTVKFNNTSGEIAISYPNSVLDKICCDVSSSRIQFKQDIKELIEDSVAELNCVLGNVETHSHASLQLTLNQIAELKPGDVILTDKEGDSQVTISIQGKNKFEGIPGIYKDKKGVKITSFFS
ncbi:MAG TPA: FliM/FliN family flagellar motor switch protein [Terriglobales bacterium]|nr:FliM/FliN family flagellar motor switch protein [Terriglobales bacterium]